MTTDGLRQFHETRPFRPFVVHMADGRRLRVPHPEFLARSRSGRTAVLYGSGDSFEMIDLLHIQSISVGNGKRTKSKSARKKRP